jgi:hypothetical protein
MFCQKCGNPLREGDTSCRICETSTIEANRLENKTAGADFDWNLEGFPTPKKTEDIDFDWNIDGMLNHKEEIIENSGSAMEKDKKQPSELMEELNKFFTFEKANEDFQHLLDKEYNYIEPTESAKPTDVDASEHLIEEINEEVDEISPVDDWGIEGNSGKTDEIQPETPETDDVKADEFSGPKIFDSDDSYNGEERHIDEEEPEVIWINRIDREIHENHSIEMEDLPEKAVTEQILTAIPDSEQRDEKQEEKQEEKKYEPPQIEKEAQNLWFENNENEAGNKRKFSIGRGILIIIVIALLIEVAMLGFQYFMPNTLAAQKAGKINESIAMGFVQLKDRALELFKSDKGEANPTGPSGAGEGVQDPDEEKDQPQDSEKEIKDPITAPMSDKEALVASALGSNKNIVTVKSNEELKWKAGKEYKLSDIKDSKPIDDNYWYTASGGEHIYYDKSIAAAVIEFDSRWVDYVNGGSDEVIKLTKEGSAARKNAESFSKVGKVNQTFLLLEIGEIRRGKDAFYLWTYEEISEIQGSKSTTNKYNWIYRLEPKGEKMEIVSYYKY